MQVREYVCVRVSASAVARACSHACLHIFESDSVRALCMLKGLYKIKMSLVWFGDLDWVVEDN